MKIEIKYEKGSERSGFSDNCRDRFLEEEKKDSSKKNKNKNIHFNDCGQYVSPVRNQHVRTSTFKINNQWFKISTLPTNTLVMHLQEIDFSISSFSLN